MCERLEAAKTTMETGGFETAERLKRVKALSEELAAFSAETLRHAAEIRSLLGALPNTTETPSPARRALKSCAAEAIYAAVLVACSIEEQFEKALALPPHVLN